MLWKISVMRMAWISADHTLHTLVERGGGLPPLLYRPALSLGNAGHAADRVYHHWISHTFEDLPIARTVAVGKTGSQIEVEFGGQLLNQSALSFPVRQRRTEMPCVESIDLFWCGSDAPIHPQGAGNRLD